MGRRAALLVLAEVICVEVGHWCNRCALPSGYLVRYVVHTGPSSCFHTTNGCTECGHEDVELIDTPTTIWQS